MRIELHSNYHMTIYPENAEDFGCPCDNPTDIFWQCRVYDPDGNLIDCLDTDVYKDDQSIPVDFLKTCLDRTQRLQG